MSVAPYDVNSIEVNGVEMLLTTTGWGAAVHLTRPAETPNSGLEATPFR
jgi:hypothetical protein